MLLLTRECTPGSLSLREMSLPYGRRDDEHGGRNAAQRIEVVLSFFLGWENAKGTPTLTRGQTFQSKIGD
jgi:hypothetical protein